MAVANRPASRQPPAATSVGLVGAVLIIRLRWLNGSAREAAGTASFARAVASGAGHDDNAAGLMSHDFE
jgi:hypothetical protein